MRCSTRGACPCSRRSTRDARSTAKVHLSDHPPCRRSAAVVRESTGHCTASPIGALGPWAHPGSLVTIIGMSTTRPPDPPAEPGPEAGRRPASLPTPRFGEPPASAPADQEADATGPGRPVSRMRLEPLLPRRQQPHLLVEVDGTPATY